MFSYGVQLALSSEQWQGRLGGSWHRHLPDLPWVEFDQRSLFFGEFESEFRQPNQQLTQASLGIAFSFETSSGRDPSPITTSRKSMP
jgi:hypothetical protein